MGININEEALKTPNRIATSAFIEAAIMDIEKDISFIERRYNIKLIGDREDFEKARRDWKNYTFAQIAYAVSIWRAGIYNRYSN